MTGRDRRRDRRASEEIDRGPLGTMIKEKRDALGFSQEYIAEQMNVPLSWLSKAERGEIRRPNLERMRALARVLNLNIDDMMLTAGWFRAPSAVDRMMQQLDEEGVARLRELHNRLDPLLIRLTGDDIETIRRLAETLARANDLRQSSDPTDSPAQRDPSSPETPGNPNGATSPTPDACGR
jgi:transcriptional regulator with XRE-family HTH domain